MVKCIQQESYADAAIGVIDKWVDTVRDFDVYGPTLTVSTGAGAMAQAAEILEHGFNGEAGWSAAKADAAKVWFKEIIYDRWTNTGDQRSSNWGTSALGGNMSMSIFMDIREEFEYQRDAYLFGYRDTDELQITEFVQALNTMLNITWAMMMYRLITTSLTLVTFGTLGKIKALVTMNAVIFHQSITCLLNCSLKQA